MCWQSVTTAMKISEARKKTTVEEEVASYSIIIRESAQVHVPFATWMIPKQPKTGLEFGVLYFERSNS